MNRGSGQLAGPAAGRDLPSLASLLEALPAPMRQPRFAPAGLPPRFASAFRHGGPGQEVGLSPLPARMRQETAWCLFRIIEIGGTVAVPAVNMLARRLGEAVADHEDGRGQMPASLLDLPVQEWSRRIAHAVHRRTGRLPAATTTRDTASLLDRMTGLLSAALDAGPWWQRDEWNPGRTAGSRCASTSRWDATRCGSARSRPGGCGPARSGTAKPGWKRER